MTWALAHWRALSVAAGLALAFAAGKWTSRPPPAPAVHAVESTASTRAVSERKAVVDSKGPEKITTTVEEYADAGRNCRDCVLGGVPVAGQHDVAKRTVTVTEIGPEVITEHATEQTHETAQAHLDLTVTPPPEKPGWAVGAGVSLTDKTLRLELDRRLFGNLWVGASVVPARREVGLGLRMEF